jgi:hypothetical protein
MSVVRAGRARVAEFVLSCVVGASLAGCSREALPLLPNIRPTLEVTQAPVQPDQPFFYGYELRWAGYDVDGRIDHFRFAVDPPTTVGAETTWVKTLENRQSFLFHADDVSNGNDKTAQGYHTIVLEAVDDRGGISAPVWRSLTAFTIAPTVQIVQPPPSPFFEPTFGPSFRLAWTGNDPDGRGTNKPVKYKFRLFSEANGDFPFEFVLAEPDSIRRRYGPNFATWDSVGGDTTSVNFRDLIPGPKYMAVVVGFDEAGAYSPVMLQGVNMVYFRVSYAGLLGPKMTVYNESFYYQYGSGGMLTDPASYIRTEVAAGRSVRFNWFGTTSGGSYVAGYRWMLDGNIGDETAREDENSDFNHWSRYSPLTTGVDLPPFNPAQFSETHTLYIEAIDNNQQVSLATVQFTVVRAVFDKELLFVDDTRLSGDRPVAGGCVDRPRGVWPTAAELDTFFFAKGGVPWKCYPTGTLSNPGVFSGYTFDTLGTRFLPQGILTLQRLSRYKHVVWYTDAKGARFVNDPFSTAEPMSELRFLTLPGRSNPLATWVQQGGELWLFGGGTATALQINWEKIAPADVYSNAEGELVPGRFMYDIYGWRSEITERSIAQATVPNHPIARSTSPIDYTGLPDYLFEKSPETDPNNVWAPNRIGGSSDFYQQAHVAEGLTKLNSVVEDRDPSPGIKREESVVDTLYESVGGQLGSGRPIMTVYHGGNAGQVQVFSGFQLWYWRREQQIQILDWVLQRAWGIPRANVPR